MALRTSRAAFTAEIRVEMTASFPLAFAAILVTIPATSGLSCRFIFDSCERRPSNVTSFFSRCAVRKVCHNNRSFSMLFTNYVEVDSFCTYNCDVRPVWCPWGAWTKMAQCGQLSARLIRTREMACHPGYGEPLNIRFPKTRQEFKTGPPTACEDVTDSQPKSNTMLGIIVGGVVVFLLLCFVATICCCHKRRQMRQEAARTRTGPGPQPTVVQMAAPLPPTLQPPQVTVSDDPPAYNLVVKPPAYNDALRMAT